MSSEQFWEELKKENHDPDVLLATETKRRAESQDVVLTFRRRPAYYLFLFEVSEAENVQ